jgi:Holliday junction resolvase RusA-like endonuclease
MYTIHLPGKPQSQPRPRRAKKGFFYDPSSKDKAKLKPVVLQQLTDQGFQEWPMYAVEIFFHMPFPCKWGKKKRATAECNYASETTKDLDNCAKYYNDLLPFNDAKIVTLYTEKRYSSNPRTEIKVIPFSLSP